MAAEKIEGFRTSLSHIQHITPSDAGYAERRETRGNIGMEKTPLLIAVPRNAEEVAELVTWSVQSGVDFAVFGHGNDFYGRNVVDNGLMIDMRDFAQVTVSEDRKTATIGGGAKSEHVVEKLEAEGVIAPFGNTGIVGYVGWAIFGGYGPLTSEFGLGMEGIVGAEVVDAKGNVVQANEEMLEGIRGLGGNLGIIISLTVKVYPARKLLAGPLMFDATPENIRTMVAAERQMENPKSLNLFHVIVAMNPTVLMVSFAWTSPDHEQGQKLLESYLAKMPPVKMNGVQAKNAVELLGSVKIPCLPWGAQRSMYVKSVSDKIVDTYIEAMEGMPSGVNMTWSDAIKPSASTPPNCFGGGSHVFLSFSFLTASEEALEPAQKWNDTLHKKLGSLDDDAVTQGSYLPLIGPDDRTTEQLLGAKWTRAKELKDKYDSNRVFKHAIPVL